MIENNKEKISRRDFLKVSGVSLLALGTATSAISGFARNNVTKISILRPGAPDKVKAFLEPAIDEFESKHPSIKIEPIYLGWTSWISKYPTVWANNEQPDVVLWWDFRQMLDIVRPKLVPLDDYVDPDILAKNPFVDKVQIAGTRYHLPCSVGPFVLWCRLDLFEQAGLKPKPPETWEEMREYAKKITENTDAYGYGAIASPPEMCQEEVFQYYTAATDKYWFDENLNPIFNNTGAVEALNFWKSLKPYSERGATEHTRFDVRPLLRDGKVAMTISDGPWAVPMYQEAFQKNLNETPIQPFLHPKGPVTRRGGVGLDGWVITREEKAEPAGELVSFLCSVNQQYRHDSIYGQAPVYEEELEREAFQYDFWNVFLEAAKVGYPRLYHFVSKPDAVYDILESHWQKVWLGLEEPSEALAAAEEEVKKKLS